MNIVFQEQCYALGWNSSILCLEMLSVIVIIDLDGVDIPHWYISLVCLLLSLFVAHLIMSNKFHISSTLKSSFAHVVLNFFVKT